MEKKYIVKLDDNKLAYTAIIIDGVPYIKPLQLLPYTEPDTEKIRKQGYDKGLDDIGNALRLLLFQYSNYTLQTIFGYRHFASCHHTVQLVLSYTGRDRPDQSRMAGHLYSGPSRQKRQDLQNVQVPLDEQQA